MTRPLSTITYSPIVFRDLVRIVFLIAALNELDVFSADIKNVYLTAPNLEKIYCIAGSEFGLEQDKTILVVKVLYNLKSAGMAIWFLATRLEEIRFCSSHADPDVWMRPVTKYTGEEVYKYILTYVNDLLYVSPHAEQTQR